MIGRGLFFVLVFSLALTGCDAQNSKKTDKETAKKTEGAPEVSDQKLKQNTEILHEVFQVVLMREPYSQEFGGYVNTLSQGASIEGIYNGIINSSYYGDLESHGAPASDRVLQAFSELLVSLQKELSSSPIKPTDFEIGAQPYTCPQLEKAFKAASLFKLKHVLSSEALKVIAAKTDPSGNRDAMAAWYPNWAAQMALAHVNYGLSERSNHDPAFHKQWLLSLSPDVYSDRVIWEVLNRVHRVLNTEDTAAHGGGPT